MLLLSYLDLRPLLKSAFKPYHQKLGCAGAGKKRQEKREGYLLMLPLDFFVNQKASLSSKEQTSATNM